MKKVLYIGLDVHKETIVIATAAEGRKEAREFKTIPSDYTRLLKAVRLLTPRGVAWWYAMRRGQRDTAFIDGFGRRASIVG